MQTEVESLFQAIIKKTHRVPNVLHANIGNSEKIARQLDVALISVGFKASAELLDNLSMFHPAIVAETAKDILSAVRELVGDNVKHNVYFKDFPNGVPDTIEFWSGLIEKTYGDLDDAPYFINLLELNGYGKYLHSYDEMVAAHGKFITDPKNKLTVLNLGADLDIEAHDLYVSLAESKIPLNEVDRKLLATLAELCANDFDQPTKIPVRENKAIINAARLENNQPLFVDTVTDVLRLAAHLSDGDVTLEEPTKFVTFSKPTRRAFMQALNTIDRAKHGDVNRYAEQFKRLGYNIGSNKYSAYPEAQRVFKVAAGVVKEHSLAGSFEFAINAGNITGAIEIAANAPGMFVRNVDRLVQLSNTKELVLLTTKLQEVVPKVNTRVLLSLIEHLNNREDQQAARIFVNRSAKTYVTEDKRGGLSLGIIKQLVGVLEHEVKSRQDLGRVVVNPDILDVAVPLSDKTKSNGFNVLPRGSENELDELGILRFFNYWKQKNSTTDYDLSVLLLDKNFNLLQQVSYTNLRGVSVKHSGDITSAPKGASEFIDIDLKTLPANYAYIVPQVNIFSGDDFTEAEESFFGYMERSEKQLGKPFEPASVKVKSDMRGKGRVALPLVFYKNDKGAWVAKWMHLYLNGHPNFNATENNRVTTAMLARVIVERQYLKVRYLAEIDSKRLLEVYDVHGNIKYTEPITYIGLQDPGNLPKGSRVITLANLHEIVE